MEFMGAETGKTAMYYRGVILHDCLPNVIIGKAQIFVSAYCK